MSPLLCVAGPERRDGGPPVNTLFARPEFLFLTLALVPAFLVFAYRYRKFRQAASSLDASRVFPVQLQVFRFVCLSLVWVLLVSAAARPRWGTALSATRREGASVMFVMDVSRSMGVADAGQSRLAYASRYAALLVERMGSVPCGLVLAKGEGVLAVPLTDDNRTVLDLLGSLSPTLVSAPGTDLARGVKAALSSFQANRAASRAIILFTDGDETSGDLVEASRACRAEGIRLVIVGIGTARGAEIDVYPGKADSPRRTTVLREDLLKSAALAAGSGSLYVNGLESGSALRVLAAAVPAPGSKAKMVYTPAPVNRSGEFLLAAVVCLCAGILAGGLPWRKK